MMILLTLLTMLITAIISILFFFILMAVRKAGVVILVVISPLAFACYMLPNTKTLFDKWWKLFKGCLMMYPIAGALIGGCTLASTILLSAGDGGFMMGVIAVILMVVPYLFLPKLLKGTFSALGSIGAKVSGLADKWGAKTSGAINNSKPMKRLQDAARSNAELKDANKIVEKYKDKVASGDLKPYQLHRYKQAAGIVSKNRTEQANLKAGNSDFLISEGDAEIAAWSKRASMDVSNLVATKGIDDNISDTSGFAGQYKAAYDEVKKAEANGGATVAQKERLKAFAVTAAKNKNGAKVTQQILDGESGAAAGLVSRTIMNDASAAAFVKKESPAALHQYIKTHANEGGTGGVNGMNDNMREAVKSMSGEDLVGMGTGNLKELANLAENDENVRKTLAGLVNQIDATPALKGKVDNDRREQFDKIVSPSQPQNGGRGSFGPDTHGNMAR